MFVFGPAEQSRRAARAVLVQRHLRQAVAEVARDVELLHQFERLGGVDASAYEFARRALDADVVEQHVGEVTAVAAASHALHQLASALDRFRAPPAATQGDHQVR